MNTRKILLESFCELIADRDVDDVTVQMVLDHSGVSRATFYRHYRDKYDIMNAFYKSHITAVLEQGDQGVPWTAIHEQIVQHIYQNQTYYRRAFKTEGADSFEEFLEQFAYEYYASKLKRKTGADDLSETDRVALEMLCGGHVTTLKKWVERGCDTAPDVITQVGLAFMPENLLSAL